MDKDLIKKTIFGKYKILKLIDKGSFGRIFKGINIITKELVAIKAEDWKIKGDFLESEAYFLYHLKNFGIPEIKTFGVFKKYKILVQNLLGENLEHIFSKGLYNPNFKDICMVAIQLIDRLEFIHSKYVVHRDLKPENLMIDLETGTIIYLIDFGMAKKYRSGKTKKHIKFCLYNKFSGTLRYCSTNGARGAELSRRDDLESAGYALIYLSQRGYLPWMGYVAKNKSDKYIYNYLTKKNMKEEVLCKYLPKQFCQYMKYVRSLNFEDDPDYNYLRWLFVELLIYFKCKNDLKFSWILKDKKKSRNSPNSKIPKNYSLSKRKESPHTRILRNIKNRKEKEEKMKNIKQKNVTDIIEGKPSEINQGISEISNKIEIRELPFKNNNNSNINKSPNENNKEKIDNQSDLGSKIAQFNVDINVNDSEELKPKNVVDIKNININEKFNIQQFKKKNYININYKRICKSPEEKKEKNFFSLGSNSSQEKDKLNQLKPYLHKNNDILNINLNKKNIINKTKERGRLHSNSPNIRKISKKNILIKPNNSKISNNKNFGKLNNITVKYNKNIELKKNELKRFEIPRQLNPYKNKINDFIKNMIDNKKINLKKFSYNKIKNSLTYNNTETVIKKSYLKRDPINYNKMDIKRTSSEKKQEF